MRKLKALGTLSLLALPALPGAASFADEPASVEVPVRRVLFPTKGYDDNDNIQVIVEGELPDPCYVLGKQTVSRNAAGTLVIRQYAWRRQGGACDSGDLLGESPYSEEVTVGRLPTGDYQVAFSPDDSAVSYRKLHVDPARVAAVDELNYARVTSISVRDVVIQGQPVKLTLSGPFTSSCNQLKDPVAVEKQGDTIVIRPVEINLGDCGYVLRYFEKTLDLGVLPPGEYLIHVRSKNGKALERTIRVLQTTQS